MPIEYRVIWSKRLHPSFRVRIGVDEFGDGIEYWGWHSIGLRRHS